MPVLHAVPFLSSRPPPCFTQQHPTARSHSTMREAELMQHELDRAKDSAFAQQIIDERVSGLTEFLQRQTGYGVLHEWKIDLQCHRFYFHKKNEEDWRHILDVYQGDLAEHESA